MTRIFPSLFFPAAPTSARALASTPEYWPCRRAERHTWTGSPYLILSSWTCCAYQSSIKLNQTTPNSPINSLSIHKIFMYQILGQTISKLLSIRRNIKNFRLPAILSRSNSSPYTSVNLFAVQPNEHKLN